MNREIDILGKTLTISQETEAGIGGSVWDTALVLCHYLAGTDLDDSFFKGRRFIELGAGTGVCSLVATLRGAHVTITDIKDHVSLIAKNVESNRVLLHANNPIVEEYTWGQPTRPAIQAPYNVILGSDLAYDPKHYDALLQAFETLSDQNTVILLAYEKRHKRELEFFKKLKEKFVFTKLDDSRLDQTFRADDIGIFRIERRWDASLVLPSVEELSSTAPAAQLATLGVSPTSSPPVGAVSDSGPVATATATATNSTHSHHEFPSLSARFASRASGEAVAVLDARQCALIEQLQALNMRCSALVERYADAHARTGMRERDHGAIVESNKRFYAATTPASSSATDTVLPPILPAQPTPKRRGNSMGSAPRSPTADLSPSRRQQQLQPQQQPPPTESRAFTFATTSSISTPAVIANPLPEVPSIVSTTTRATHVISADAKLPPPSQSQSSSSKHSEVSRSLSIVAVVGLAVGVVIGAAWWLSRPTTSSGPGSKPAPS